jgi:hypothetical protein
MMYFSHRNDFHYTDESWSLISGEIGRDELYDRHMLERLALNCLQNGTPAEIIASKDERLNGFRKMSEALLTFVHSMEELDYKDDDLIHCRGIGRQGFLPMPDRGHATVGR